VVVEPGHIGGEGLLQFAGLPVQPRADHQAGVVAGGPQGGEVGELTGEEEVPPAGDHADRGHRGQVRPAVVDRRPEGVPGVVLDEVPPELDRCAGDRDVGRLQRHRPCRPPHPGLDDRVEGRRQHPAFLQADARRPVQGVEQTGRPVVVEPVHDPRRGDVQ
jgi:hypothetical protein